MKMFRHTDKNGQAGFTLLETTMALVVMMIGGLGIAAVFSFSIKNNTGARDRAAAIAVAQQELERLRNLEFNNAGLNASTTTVTRTTGERSYTVRTTITNTTATLKTLEVRVTPASGSTQWALGSVTLVSYRASFALGPYGNGP
jgi:Tfp pilus assembly protein PilV